MHLKDLRHGQAPAELSKLLARQIETLKLETFNENMEDTVLELLESLKYFLWELTDRRASEANSFFVAITFDTSYLTEQLLSFYMVLLRG